MKHSLTRLSFSCVLAALTLGGCQASIVAEGPTAKVERLRESRTPRITTTVTEEWTTTSPDTKETH